ncbi:hypothetical protein Moror_11089 [Moniliophthora roreri MCA 2997]|uniref:Uncharacterized protein n=1 Tax=Moniliophthora roreri (strain MCA 2997) TaxID=1381753 RepID=V2XWT7_MONRO|nr:hypothetical protein Moror_11089 [Moniliophthora roreri MCA 2997]
MSGIPESIAELYTARSIIVYYVTTASAMYFAYGLYVLLFGTSIYIMHRHQQEQGDERLDNNLYSLLTIILFVLSTVFVVDWTIESIRGPSAVFNMFKTGSTQPMVDYYLNSPGKIVANSFNGLVPIFLNGGLHADSSLLFATNATALVGIIIDLIYLARDIPESLHHIGNALVVGSDISSAVINSLITLLTAGRMWWIHRQVRTQAVYASDTLVGTISRIILESGIIYPVFIVLNQVVGQTSTPDEAPFSLYPLAVLSAGIAPTLIIVRAKLGKGIESLHSQVSEIRFTSRPAPNEGTIIRPQAQVHSIGNIRASMENDVYVGMSKEATAV